MYKKILKILEKHELILNVICLHFFENTVNYKNCTIMYIVELNFFSITYSYGL